MPNYQLWVCNDDYTRHVLLANSGDVRTWSRLTYRQAINDIESATVELVANSPKIPDVELMKRLLIYRDGVIVFSGLLEKEGWSIRESAPDGDTYVLSARSPVEYATWRLALPASGAEYDQRTGPLDDVAKDYVYYHMAAGAAAARQFADLTVQADAGAAASATVQARYDELLSILQTLASAGGFDWRFVPSASGCQFQTKYPRWGVDRSKGNGVNDEMVFSLDRRNFVEMSYTKDLLGHYNHVYVGGQGEGAARAIVERSDATAITANKRREMFYNASRYTLTSSLNTAGDVVLAEKAPAETMTVTPKPGIWPDQFGIGDVVTLYANRYGRTFDLDAKATALEVSISQDGVESVKPTLEAV